MTNKEYQEKVLRFLYAKSVEDNIFITTLENAIRRNTQQALEEYSQLCKRYRSTIEIQAEILYRQLQTSYIPPKKERKSRNHPYNRQFNEQNIQQEFLHQMRQRNNEIPVGVVNPTKYTQYTQQHQQQHQQQKQEVREALGI